MPNLYHNFALLNSHPTTMVRTIVIFSILLFAHGMNAQYDFDGAYYYPEAMKDDLDELVSAIEQMHPDPYRYHSEKEFDMIVKRVRQSFNEPRSIYEYMNGLMPVFHALGDAHTRMELPAEIAYRTMRDVPLIPLQVSVDGDRLYLMDELKGFRTIDPGSELVSINGFNSAEILEGMRKVICVDGKNASFADHTISMEFPLLYHRAIERARSFRIRYRTSDGAEKQAELKAITVPEMARSGREPVVKRKSYQWTNEQLDEGKVVWLRIPTLSRASIDEEGIRPERILKETEKLLSDSKVKVLVVDLRGTTGMEFHLAERVYRLFAKGPFRAIRNVHVRSFDQPLGVEVESFPNNELSLFKDRMILHDDIYELDPRDELIALVQSTKKPFGGEVFILQDGGTIEAGAALAMMNQRDKRARLVGKETGTNATAFCGGQFTRFVTRRTGLRFTIPMMRFELERGSNPVSSNGLKPDLEFHLRTNDPDHAEQAVEQDLLMFIGEWH